MRRPETELNSKGDIVLKINHFYWLFQKDKNIPLEIRKQVNFETYKSIVSKFFLVYVLEILYLKKTMYFPLTGRLKLNRCGGWIRTFYTNKYEPELKKTNHALGFYWYEKTHDFFMFTKVKKLVGSTNILTRLEKEWTSKNDITLLPTAKELKKLHQVIIKK